MGAHPLLERYNPLLAIFPHDPAQSRPGSIALETGTRTWGDYHPCTVEFFAALAHLQTETVAFDYASLLPWGRGRWQPLPVTPLAEMAERVRRASPGTTRGWALDLAAIPSQSEVEAWRVYGRVLAGSPFEETVYGRIREYDDGRIALQYWYLYVYNDFGNKHEGDWEMAIIELDPHQRPVRMAVSAHMGGTQRRWRDVEKDGERPILYVARGSHAGYFEYRREGYDASASDLTRGLRLPAGLGFVKPLVQAAARAQSLRVVQRLPFVRIWRDHVPALPGAPSAREGDVVGELTTPALREMPEDADPADDERWWRRFDGSWGSDHVRLSGRTGPDSPWDQRARWDDPLAWAAGCATSFPSY